MANVNTNNIPVPRIARNKRIYAGNTGISRSSQGASESPALEWVSVSVDEVIINRDTIIQGDLTVQNLSGLAGDTVIVNENGTFATIREVINETPAGLINNVNVTYTLAYLPDGLIRLYKNGQKLKLTTDYTITGQTITLTSPLWSDGYEDVLLADYRYVTYSPGGSPVPAIPDQVSWTAMSRGAAAQSTGFDIKISRIGKMLTISGSFNSVNDPGPGSVIASIPVATIAGGMSLTLPVWTTSNEISSNETNRGMRLYLDTFDPITKPNVQLKVNHEHDAGHIYFTITTNII